MSEDNVDWNYTIKCERCEKIYLASGTPVIGGSCHFCWSVEEQYKFWPWWFQKQFFSTVYARDQYRVTENQTANVVLRTIQANPSLRTDAILHGINKAYCQGDQQATHRYWMKKLIELIPQLKEMKDVHNH